MWYVIQTVTGQEDMVLDMVRSIIPRESYNECFCIKRECMEKAEGESGIVLKALFPGYVFLDTDTPKDAYYSLKNVPKLTKVLRNDDDFFLPVAEEEQDFLQNIQSEGHVVRAADHGGGRRGREIFRSDRQTAGAETVCADPAAVPREGEEDHARDQGG